jgi:hypothetical protein
MWQQQLLQQLHRCRRLHLLAADLPLLLLLLYLSLLLLLHG